MISTVSMSQPHSTHAVASCRRSRPRRTGSIAWSAQRCVAPRGGRAPPSSPGCLPLRLVGGRNNVSLHSSRFRASAVGATRGRKLCPCPQELAACRNGAQPLYVAHRRNAEETFIFAAEVRSVVVAHAEARAGRVETLAEHETAGLLEPQLLLEL